MEHVWRKLDYPLIFSMFAIIAFGAATLWSLSSGSFSFFERQIIWIAIGVATFFVFSFLDYRIFRTTGFLVLLYLILVVSLALLFFIGERVRGVVSWFRVGAVFLQPVEAVKLILVILLAKYFSKRHIEIRRIETLMVSAFYFALPFSLTILQPDVGSALVLLAIWLSGILFSGILFRHFAVLVVILVMAAALSWFFVLEPYQKLRIISFLDSSYDLQGVGYNVEQARIAIGSGRIWGKGIGAGSQSRLNFLPEPATDFIFAAFAEEWGFMGSSALILLYGLMLWRILRIGMFAENNFAKLFTLGFAALILTQVGIHMGMNLGLLPVTGLTLPFMSYGGSSLITLMAGLGIVESIKIHS